VRPENIPDVLKETPQWLLWNYEERKPGTFSKIPYNANDPRMKGSTTNPDTWSDFDTAFRRYSEGKSNGIGYVFTKNGGLIGIDIDSCLKDGVADDWAQEIVESLNTYAEVSVSGNGLHLFVKGRIRLPKNRVGNLEIYTEGRYFTVTGNRFGDCREIAEKTDALNVIVERYFGAPLHSETSPGAFRRTSVEKQPDASGNTISQADVPRGQSDIASLSILERTILRTTERCVGRKFRELWNGEWESLDYRSCSEADMALLRFLWNYTNGNEAMTLRLFRASGMMRDKCRRDDYLAVTIKKIKETGKYDISKSMQ
jgi:primase-polymerase (primpol)-like protein